MAQVHGSKTGETHAAIAEFAFSRPAGETLARDSIASCAGRHCSPHKGLFCFRVDFSMTGRGKSARGLSMFRWSFFLLCMFVVSLTTVAIVHANEVPNPTLSATQISIECSGQVHSEGDGDQSQGDSDKAVPHHHGCHGAASYLPARLAETTVFAIITETLMTVDEAVPGRWSVGPDLRPPIA